MLAQETRISDYVIFSGDGSYPGAVEQRKPARPGYSVQLGSLSYIQGGSVGSYGLIKSTGNVTFESNIYSRASIYLSNNNIISGRISAANIPDRKGSALLIGAGASIALLHSESSSVFRKAAEFKPTIQKGRTVMRNMFARPTN